MKQFYEAYPDKGIVSALLTQCHWTHHMIILSKSRSFEERQFYLKLSVVEGYSSRELERQIDSSIYERAMLTSNSIVPTSNKNIDRYIKDRYIFEFLGLPDDHTEHQLRKSLLKNLKLFLLELG